MLIVLKPLALLLVCFSIAGCSVKFAYNNADRLVRWQISDYVSLDSAQKEVLNGNLDTLLAWHRTEHLPQYAVFTANLAQTWSDGVTERQIADLFARTLSWGEEVQQRSMPLAIELLASLSDKQVANLPKKMERKNVEIEADELDKSLEKIQSQWAKEFEDGMEQFTGRLDKSQRAYIALRATAYQPERVLWADYRRRWQADLMTLLEKRREQGFAQAFTELVEARETYYGETFVQVSDENITLSREIASHLLSNLDERQSKRFLDFLTQLAEDFDELSRQRVSVISHSALPNAAHYPS